MENIVIRMRLLLLALTAMALLLCHRLPAQVVVIANPRIAANDVSRSDLRDVFTGASTSIKGASSVSLILLKNGPTHDEMLTLYVGKSDAAFRATWRSLIFSGQGVMPKTVDSDAAVVDFVAHTPGAIGYIGKASPHEGVKVLAVK